ncbi:Tetraspanin-31-like protein [Leptotrombidium deliense]|uniref:Tetraspanin-31-like protein n=1 Tax=Leptotrombidium deliense TaxID=299467 RepID=A0A443S8P6_9ACAR|nr:Tetraspanin-31-like protein [Leptotrombidium deliense]
MCGGFNCTRNALTALNLLYILVSVVLIGVAAYGRAASVVSNINIIGGIIFCGGFLFFLSLVGLIGARKHHQYMIILFALFVVQFSITCACLAVSEAQEVEIGRKGWHESSNETRREAQHFFNCCGYENETVSQSFCMKSHVTCCRQKDMCNCENCAPKIHKAIDSALNISGGIGLFFSFTEFIGVWLTVRYRNQKDPRADPSAFI